MPAGHGISDRAAVEGGRATRKLRRDVSPAWHPHHALSGRGGRGRLSRPWSGWPDRGGHSPCATICPQGVPP